MPFPETLPRTLSRHSTVDRAAVDRKSRSVALSFSSESPIRDTWGPPVVLLHESGAADFSRLSSALLNHDPDRIIGRVDDARLDSDRVGRARIVLDKDEDGDRALGKVISGSLRGVSVSYKLEEGQRVGEGESWTSPGGRAFEGPLLVATRWAAVEISLTPVPADVAAGIGRSTRIGVDETMPKTKQNTDPNPPPPAGGSDDNLPLDQRIDRSERARVAELARIARTAGLEDRLPAWVEDGTAPADASREALEEVARRTPPLRLRPLEYGREEGEKWSDAAQAGLLARAGLYRPEDFGRGVEPRRLTLGELARETLRRAGDRVDGLSATDAAIRVVGGRSGAVDTFSRGSFAHATTDFPAILENVMEKGIAVAFREAPSTAEQWCRTGEVSKLDVDVSRVSASLSPDLQEVPELMPISEVSLSDAKEVGHLTTYGARFSISRQAIINDDLGIFQDTGPKLARAARRKIDDLVYSRVTTNAAMNQDSVALFASGHGNLLDGAGSALASAGLGAAVKALRLMTEPSGAYLSLAPRYLIVPPSLEATAEELISSLVKPDGSTAADSINIYSRMGIQVIVEPRLETDSTTRWYLACEKQDSAIEILRLAGYTSPTLVREMGTTILGFSWTCWYDCDAAVVDYRGLVRNNGA